jgi:tRNA(Arg) A34 adenosine deaminase TadA
MTTDITEEDKKYLDLCIQKAEETFKKFDNYPVGAALVIDGKLIEVCGNRIKGQKSFVHHAENQLIINNATKLYDAFDNDKEIVLYTTLEPCIQCLGASVTNHINKIVYIQKDPNGGACDLKHDNIGLFYKDKWPEIIHAPISNKPLDLMLEFFRSEIKKGNTKWPSKMLSLLEK